MTAPQRYLLAFGLVAIAGCAVWLLTQVANLSSNMGFIIWTPIMAAIIGKLLLPNAKAK